MAIFKQVWQFRSDTATWSDVYYKSANAITDASDFPLDFLNKRLALLAVPNILQKIRVSDIASPRVSATINVNLNGNAGIDRPANFTESVTCTLVSANPLASRKLWLRGTPEGAAFRNQTGSQDLLDPGFRNALITWFGALSAGSYIILKRIPPGQGGIVQFRAQLADGAAGDGTTKITFAGNLGVAVGDTITLSQMPEKDVPGLKGNFKVKAIDGNIVTVNYSTPNNVTVPLTSGFGKKLAFFTNTVITSTRCSFAFLGGRQTKNAASGSRGARSAKRQRALA